jgi:hypothetical protein
MDFDFDFDDATKPNSRVSGPSLQGYELGNRGIGVVEFRDPVCRDMSLGTEELE